MSGGLVCSACGRPTQISGGGRFECKEGPGETSIARAIPRTELHPSVRASRIAKVRAELAKIKGPKLSDELVAAGRKLQVELTLLEGGTP